MPMRARQTRRHASVPVNQVSPPIRPTSVHVGIAAALGIHVHPPVRTRRIEKWLRVAIVSEKLWCHYISKLSLGRDSQLVPVIALSPSRSR